MRAFRRRPGGNAGRVPPSGAQRCHDIWRSAIASACRGRAHLLASVMSPNRKCAPSGSRRMKAEQRCESARVLRRAVRSEPMAPIERASSRFQISFSNVRTSVRFSIVSLSPYCNCRLAVIKTNLFLINADSPDD